MASFAMAMHVTSNTVPTKSSTEDSYAVADEDTAEHREDDTHDLLSRTVQDTYEDWRGEGPKPKPQCDGPSINQTDYAQAVANLIEYCENHNIGRGSIYASVVDQAVVYACSRGGLRDCSGESYLKLEKLLDESCKGKPGYVVYGGVLYGRDVPGRVICKNYNHRAHDFEVQKGKPVWVNGMMWEEWKSGEH